MWYKNLKCGRREAKFQAARELINCVQDFTNGGPSKQQQSLVYQSQLFGSAI